jgi:hypothetical protein
LFATPNEIDVLPLPKWNSGLLLVIVISPVARKERNLIV